MTAETLLDHIKAAGGKITIVDGALACKIPKGAMTPEIKQALLDHKAELLAILMLEPFQELLSAERMSPDLCRKVQNSVSNLRRFSGTHMLKVVEVSVRQLQQYDAEWRTWLAKQAGDSEIDDGAFYEGREPSSEEYADGSLNFAAQ